MPMTTSTETSWTSIPSAIVTPRSRTPASRAPTVPRAITMFWRMTATASAALRTSPVSMTTFFTSAACSSATICAAPERTLSATATTPARRPSTDTAIGSARRRRAAATISASPDAPVPGTCEAIRDAAISRPLTSGTVHRHDAHARTVSCVSSSQPDAVIGVWPDARTGRPDVP